MSFAKVMDIYPLLSRTLIKMTAIEFTKSQADAIESTGESMSVIAGAGSGKTLVLIERCMKIIGENGAGLSNLLAITFTEKAAGELKAKIRKRLDPKTLPRLASAWIGTFHSFCARILRLNAPAVGLDPSFHILDENGARLIAQRAVEEAFLGLLDDSDASAALLVEEIEYRNAIGVIEELMSSRWHAEGLLRAPKPAEERESKLIGAALRCFLAVKEVFESRMARMNTLDFQGIEIRALELLKNSPDALSQYRKRFRHILVDEYQDTNDIQTELLKLLFDPPRNKLFIVGDPRQSIYRFRGANVSCFNFMTGLIQSSGGRAITLAENFRSRPGIINFVNRASASLEKSLFAKDDGELIAKREDASCPTVTALFCRSDDDANVAELRAIEAEAIAKHILSLVTSGQAGFGDIACLFQAITATDAYESAFRRNGIPYRVYGGRRLLDRPEVSDLVAALNYAADQSNDIALLALARSPLIGLSDGECVLLAGETGKDFHRAVMGHPVAGRLLSRIATAGIHRRPSEILRMVIDLAGYEIFCARSDLSGTKQANIDRLISLAESIENETPVSLAAFVDFISALRDDSARLGDPPSAVDSGKLVRCMTVHAAKGLEFPVVFLPDLIRQPVNSGGAWMFVRGAGLGFKRRDPEAPFADMIASDNYAEIIGRDRAEEGAESRRLSYVAMTRAEERLIFPIHEKDKSAWRWHNWFKALVSDGVETIETGADGGNALSAGEAKKDASCLNISRLADFSGQTRRPRAFIVSELESFERCPQEYYLKYVAGLPAEMILAKRTSGIPASVHGSIIHGVLEKITPDNVEELLKTECLKHQIFPDKSTLMKLLKPLKTFIADPLFAEIRNSEREVPFSLKIGRHTVTGKIDCIRKTVGAIEIIDFKTDRISAEEAPARAENYGLQMTAYAIAAELATGNNVARTILYFLEPQKAWAVPMDDSRRNDGLNQIESIIGRICAGDCALGEFSPPCTKPDCRCPYHLNDLCWLDRGKK